MTHEIGEGVGGGNGIGFSRGLAEEGERGALSRPKKAKGDHHQRKENSLDRLGGSWGDEE